MVAFEPLVNAKLVRLVKVEDSAMVTPLPPLNVLAVVPPVVSVPDKLVPIVNNCDVFAVIVPDPPREID